MNSYLISKRDQLGLKKENMKKQSRSKSRTSSTAGFLNENL